MIALSYLKFYRNLQTCNEIKFLILVTDYKHIYMLVIWMISVYYAKKQLLFCNLVGKEPFFPG